MPTQQLPPVTDAHRRQAFAMFAWPGLTFEAAMRIDMRRRLIEARAHGIRKAEATGRAVTRHPFPAKAAAPAPGPAWCPNALFGPRPQPTGYIDHKRAAAGDRED